MSHKHFGFNYNFWQIAFSLNYILQLSGEAIYFIDYEKRDCFLKM